jgi:GT2 family glycosyltransferase/glycosyltransferase involved in cell wall biosynthesis
VAAVQDGEHASVPPDAHLIRIVFASGPAAVNREVIDRLAAAQPKLPLLVVAEFEPHRGEWIPWHVLRGFDENLAAVKAAIGDRRIETAAMVLAPAGPLARMRLAAKRVAGGVLVAYDEDLRVIRGLSWGKYFLRRVVAKAGSRRTKQWLRRMAHPGEAEIPVRARAAQMLGIISSRFRVRQRESPVPGAQSASDGVSVVIPSRNGRELLARLLPDLVPQVTVGEVIVSDNGSTDEITEWLAREYPAVRVIRSTEPLSFAKAVNAGIIAARFNRTLLLNNDMIVQPGFVEALNRAFERVPNLFCATAQIFFPPGARREETGKAVWRRESPTDFPVRCDDPIPGEDLTWVLYGSGGCSLFDAEKLRALGGVSEVFDPAYVEDLDLGYRAWKRGWPSVFCAGARVEHRHRATTARYYSPRELDSLVERNYLQFLIHAVGSPALFRSLWLDAIRRLQLRANDGEKPALDTLRRIPKIGPWPAEASGPLSETEILALGAGDIAVFPGRAGRGGAPIVIASPYLPFPLSHGGAVRIYNLMKNAAQDRDQVLLAFADELSTPPEELLAICVEVILVRRRGSHYRKNTPLPDVVEEFASEAFRACLKQTIQRWEPDVVQLEFTQMAHYADACRPAKTILVEHDITFDLQQQLLAASPETGASRLELEKQLAKWKVFETGAWKNVDCVVAMSQRDERMVSGARRVVCLPNGVDTDRFHASGDAPEAKRLLFIGSFAHLPNLLALEYFLRDVRPLLGGFTLHIIAGARHEYYLDFYRTRVAVDFSIPGVEVEGFVADVRDAYRRAELVLAPLTASAGTNIKVLEAMAMGRVVVSTSAGVNGLDVSPGHDVIVTDSAADMAAAILRLSADSEARRTIESRARETALRYDWREIARKQTDLYKSAGDKDLQWYKN